MDLDRADEKTATRPRTRLPLRWLLWTGAAALAILAALAAGVGTHPAPAPAPDAGPIVPPTPGEPAPDPRVLVLPQGRYLTSEICLRGAGDDPVAVTVRPGGGVEVRRADGLRVPSADVTGLLPCLLADGGQPELRTAPGAVLRQFDGAALPLSDTMPVAVVATLTLDGDREPVCWVWRKQHGVLHTGLVPLGQLAG